MFFYNAQVAGYALETLYDLNAGRYLALGFENEEVSGANWSKKFSKVEYKPNALRQEGVR